MKTLATLTLLSTVLAALVLAQTRQFPLGKDSPTNYGAYGFDISWVDNSTQKYYLTDRTNNAIDLVDAATDRLRTSFVNYVERCFGSSPETSEPCRSHHLPDARLASLRAEAESHFLRPRTRRAQER
jgi:hypothetical protein